MKKYHSNHHSIDLLFTISLFFVFTISALYVTMAGANLYESMVLQTTADYSAFTPISYLEQKLQRYDNIGGISVVNNEDMDILCLHETIDSTPYTTYIYEKNGTLMELFIADNTIVSFDNGTKLMDCDNLILTQENPHLLSISLTINNNEKTLTVPLRAKED